MNYQPGFSVVGQLMRRATEVTGYSEADIKFGSRQRPLCHVRFAIMATARERGVTLGNIGRCMGGFDHTSVIHGVRRAKELESDPDFSQLMERLDA